MEKTLIHVLKAGFISLMLFGTIPFAGYGQEQHLNASKLLQDSLLLRAEIIVDNSHDKQNLWHTTARKITIPGRSVSIVLEKDKNRLEVVFIIYPANGNSLLVAQSNIVYQGDFDTALTTFPLNYGVPLYYYPLGRSKAADSSNTLGITMEIVVKPYLETMDENTQNTLKEALEDSSRFKLSEADF